MGSFMRVDCWYLPLQTFLAEVQLPVYGAVLGGQSLYTYDEPGNACLLIGNEGKGIRDALLPYITHAVTIPKLGGAESLNAGVATGIIVSHLKKK
jgi:TrmH family RNA methyltransferase